MQPSPSGEFSVKLFREDQDMAEETRKRRPKRRVINHAGRRITTDLRSDVDMNIELCQFYETEIADVRKGCALRLLTLPNRSLKAGLVFEDINSVATSLDLTLVESVRAAYLPHAFAALLQLAQVEPGRSWSEDVPESEKLRRAYQATGQQSRYFDFAETVAFTRVVPFEASLLSAESLGSLTKAGRVGLGAALGILAAGGAAASGPVLLLYAGAGIIVVYAAPEIGQAFGDKFRQLMGLRLRQPVRA
jgi:hypothetical protein